MLNDSSMRKVLWVYSMSSHFSRMDKTPKNDQEEEIKLVVDCFDITRVW